MKSVAIKESDRVLKWVKIPQQARTRAGLSRLLDAAEALVAEKSFDEISVNQIAQRAGSSVGGFYRRFRDKHGLLQALHERFCEEARATADNVLDPARWVGAPAEEIIVEFTAFLVRIYRDREGALRTFLFSGINDAVVRQRTRLLTDHLHQRLAELLAERRDEITHPQLDLGAAFALHIVLGTLNHVIQLQPTTLGLADPRLAGELSRAFGAYLGVGAANTQSPNASRRTS
jgi:AcrR family transcriptional regulator